MTSAGLDPVAVLTAFARTLRDAGIAADQTRLSTSVAALDHLDARDRRQLYWATRLTLCAEPADLPLFDALFDRVVPGGIIVLDDYEWAGVYRPQKLAEDAWFDARSYRVFPLPTGQGIVLKR